MEKFLSAIPAAATSPYAFVAYAICATIFIFAGAKLRELRGVLKVIKDIPPRERRVVIQSVTGSPLPDTMTPEMWVRNNRNRWIFLLLGGVILMTGAVTTVALVGPPTLSPPPSAEEAKTVAEDFAKDLDAGSYTTAYEKFFPPYKAQASLEQWLELSHRYREPLGVVESRSFAGTYPGEVTIQKRVNAISVQYFTKFAHMEKPIREMIGLASPGAPAPWQVIGYAVDVPPDSPLLSKSGAQ